MPESPFRSRKSGSPTSGPVGCTAFWDPRAWPGRSDLFALEIGFTWLGASAQGAGINVEAKMLLSAMRSSGSE